MAIYFIKNNIELLITVIILGCFMQIDINKALNHFYKSPSFELIYLEAVSNCLDAGANRISIRIEIEEFSKPETLVVVIEDNGKGFNDENFAKFSKLLASDSVNNKGLGRLVYLHYFDEIHIQSSFIGGSRDFIFSRSFDGRDTKKTNNKLSDFGSKLVFSKYNKKKVKEYDYLKPEYLKHLLLYNLLPRLLFFKENELNFSIKICLETKSGNSEQSFASCDVELTQKDIPEFETIEFNGAQLDLHSEFRLKFRVEKTEDTGRVMTAIASDNRAIMLEYISSDKIPFGWHAIFILQSAFFDAKSNDSRQDIELDTGQRNTLKSLFLDLISKILSERIPQIKDSNDKTKNAILETYPHYAGLLNDNSVGLVSRDEVINVAQQKYFKAEREILEAKEISDDVYDKALEKASRVLTEYVLYRAKIILKMKEISDKDSESKIHNIILPQRTIRYQTDTEVFNYNNAWILDDKFMSYQSALSEYEMSVLSKHIDESQAINNQGRPDIAFVFSQNPNYDAKVDVVIVELKKIGIGIKDSANVVLQLRERARLLLDLYGTKISRIWLYGVVDFNDAMLTYVDEEEYTRLYSCGHMFYKDSTVISDDRKIKVNLGIYLTSYESLIKDAESRNETFMNILKNSFK